MKTSRAEERLRITKISIIMLIREMRMALYKTTIHKELSKKGFKKTVINKSLQELRKEKTLALYKRRWGLR